MDQLLERLEEIDYDGSSLDGEMSPGSETQATPVDQSVVCPCLDLKYYSINYCTAANAVVNQ